MKEENNINSKTWEILKIFIKKQPGFISWIFDNNYKELVIKFKTNIQVINVQKHSNSLIEISAFGDSVNSEIRVQLNKDVISALDIN